MNQNTVHNEANKRICESLGCFAKATSNIEVQVGKQGTISLHLCEGCVNKFQDN